MKFKILIVDDNPGNIQILSGILAPLYETYFATSGPQCLELVIRQQIDLILLDVVMPGMDGFELCQRLKESPLTREIPVIFVTAMMAVEDQARGFELGAVDYIVKPVSPPTTLARVKTHLELKSQRDYLRQLSQIDGLTGIPNRRRFDQALETEWLRARRNGLPLTLLMMDIDHFKRFNDTHGHLAGDACLKKVAQALSDAMYRPGDFVARYGGEEFACILPECDAAGAREVSRHCLENVAALDVREAISDDRVSVTLSIGGATLIPRERMAPTALLEQADSLLYQAKQQGRNRFVTAHIE